VAQAGTHWGRQQLLTPQQARPGAAGITSWAGAKAETAASAAAAVQHRLVSPTAWHQAAE